MPSPETAHHAGSPSRTIPLVQELRPVLTEAFDLAPDGAEFVVDPKVRKEAQGRTGWLNANPRTMFERIIRHAGLESWFRLFHDLRASRETELVETCPAQVVTNRLQNTPSLAMRHYFMTTDAHSKAATNGDGEAPAGASTAAAQHPPRQAHAASRSNSQAEHAAPRPIPVLPVLASRCDSSQRP